MKHRGIRPANLGAFAGEAHLHEGFMLTASAAWRKAAPQLRAGGLLTEEKVRKAFRQMDSDNSGELDEFELRKVVKTMAPQLTDIDIKLMVACADTDDSGVITESEFIAIMMHNHESDKPYWEKYGKRDMHRLLLRLALDGYCEDRAQYYIQPNSSLALLYNRTCMDRGTGHGHGHDKPKA